MVHLHAYARMTSMVTDSTVAKNIYDKGVFSPSDDINAGTTP